MASDANQLPGNIMKYYEIMRGKNYKNIIKYFS